MRRALRVVYFVFVTIGVLVAAGAALFPELAAVLFMGDSRALREERDGPAPPETARRSDLLIVALDGVGRDVLYGALRAGELPGFAALLGGAGLEHAALRDDVLSPLPSTTFAGWAAVFTGEPPGVNGAPGDEFFVREQRELALPVPISVKAPSAVAALYVDGYADRFLAVPTIYERLREREPRIRIWVSMSQIQGGADRLLFASRTALFQAFTAFFDGRDVSASWRLFEELDQETVETIVDELEDDPPPEVLTVYFPTTDFVAHDANGDPHAVQRRYLREVLDRHIGTLARALGDRGLLEERFVIVLSDHGHSPVSADGARALELDDAPAAVLRAAGFRVRPFKWRVKAHDYQAVLGSQEAIAFVYLADRSGCPAPGQPCPWERPPRFEEDVLAAAHAFAGADRAGTHAPGLRGALDLILVRRPRVAAGPGDPYLAYVDGRLVPVAEHLARRGRTRYVAVAERLRELGAGARGDRAGDLLLVTHNGDRDDPAERFYFSAPQRSGHGSPSAQHSRVPLILAHRHRDRVELEALLDASVGPRPRLHQLARLFVALRDQPRRALPRAASP